VYTTADTGGDLSFPLRPRDR